MKKILSIACMTIALAGCNTPNHIEGQLALSSAINVNAKQFFGGVKKTAVAAGRYATSLALNSDGAEVRIHTSNGEVIFAVPNAKADMLGNINMSAAQLSQEFSLQGKLFDTRDSIDRVRPEQCIHHYDQQYTCHDENCCDRNGANCRMEQRCGYEQVPVYGSENVHETGYQDTKNASISLVKAAKAVGKYNGSYTYNEQIQTSEVVSGCAL
ncbi:MAG: hypothetical protein ACXVB9_03735 [Bdellovibrionota bacterium]